MDCPLRVPADPHMHTKLAEKLSRKAALLRNSRKFPAIRHHLYRSRTIMSVYTGMICS